MERQALGLIESKGFVSAIEAADAALKAADVRLLGYEMTKGQGLITIKLEGNVSAIETAVATASAAASKLGALVSAHVIPRPHEHINIFIEDKIAKNIKKDTAEALVAHEEVTTEEVITEECTEAPYEAQSLATCNLCKDINCPRKKGEPRSMCFHYLQD